AHANESDGRFCVKLSAAKTQNRTSIRVACSALLLQETAKKKAKRCQLAENGQLRLKPHHSILAHYF
ncbi:hypothetical protein V6U78_12705, partial [Marinospirillum sp. MEB164]